MDTYFIDLRFRVSGHETEGQLEEHLDRVLDHLAELDGPVDPDLGARLSTGDVMFSMGVEAASGPEALRDALVAVRTAIHACEGCTPGWEGMFDEIEQTIRSATAEDMVDA